MTLRQRSPRVRDKKYLGYIAALGQDYGCVICQREAEVCHVRFAEVCFGKGWWSCQNGLASNGITSTKCTVCGGTGDRFGKRPTGAGEKPSDIWTVPLCPEHHRNGPEAQHNSNEREWWEEKGIDVLALCKALQEAYPSIEDGVAVLGKVVGR